jgi:hypothetical protein
MHKSFQIILFFVLVSLYFSCTDKHNQSSKIEIALNLNPQFYNNSQLPYLNPIINQSKIKDGFIWRRNKSDTTNYIVVIDSILHLGGNKDVVLYRWLPKAGIYSHADLAQFQLVEYSNSNGEIRFLKESKLLPVWSPFCDKIKTTLINLKNTPHLFFNVEDGNNGVFTNYNWIVSITDKNFGSTILEKNIQKSNISISEADAKGISTAIEMEAEINFDSSLCDQGKWIINVKQQTTERLTTESEIPTKAIIQKIKSTKPIVNTVNKKLVFEMDLEGKLRQVGL